MAKVTVFLNHGQRQEIESNATKWKDLQTEMAAKGICYTQGKMDAIVGETEVTLESPDAQLPEGQDFTVFLFPKQVKSGSTAVDALREAMANITNAANNVQADTGTSVPAAPVQETISKDKALAAVNAIMFGLEAQWSNMQLIKDYILTTNLDALDEKAVELRAKLSRELWG